MFSVRKERPTPYIDRTMYVSWNAMFVSAYLSAATVFGGSLGGGCRRFALKTLDRMLRETWSESRGFSHRMGGPVLEGSLDDQVFGVIALLDAYESTLDPRYFDAAKRTLDNAIARYGDAEGGGFFDRPHDAAPMGGLEVRRKPFQDSPTPGANSIAAIALIRMHALHGRSALLRLRAEDARSFRGNRAAIRDVRGDVWAGGDVVRASPDAGSHHRARQRPGRHRRSKLRPTAYTASAKRCCASRPGFSLNELPQALKETLPHLSPTKRSRSCAPGRRACRRPTIRRN